MKKTWLEGIEAVNVNNPVSAWNGWFETVVLTAIVIVASFCHPAARSFPFGRRFSLAGIGPFAGRPTVWIRLWFCQCIVDIGDIGRGH